MHNCSWVVWYVFSFCSVDSEIVGITSFITTIGASVGVITLFLIWGNAFVKLFVWLEIRKPNTKKLRY